ncbi:MAG: four helix bundle protein [Acidobacteria bacterium]|nr:four helix bundle protein [Acidobacteriota bacterium]
MSKRIVDFKEMRVWQMSMDFTESVYRLSNDFPKSEICGLTSQIRRCAVSIPSNIAEGFSRKSTKEFIQFLYVSLGSCSECETQLMIARRVGYLESEREIMVDLISITKMIYSLIASLNKRKTNGK